MASNDKTKQKLMESMRKTKAGASKNTSVAEPKVTTKQKKAASKKKKVAEKKTAVQRGSTINTDPYQTRSRRVWPD